MRRLLPTAAACAIALACAPAAGAAEVPPGAEWTEATITETDGTTLHADVLRPKQLAKDAKTPVILSIGPYFNHSGQVGPAGPLEGAPYDPTAPAGPSDRFADFVAGARLMERGYTFVMVDLRGFGGSSGCLDWAGPGEQADVKAAVEWAAAQPWSTGKVGMYGKSYDGVTGLIGVALRPKGLSAVVSQEPVYDLYRYLYSDRVRYVNSLATPALYDLIAESPGTVNDSPDYNSGALDDLQRPGCPVLNWADQQERDHDAAYWKPRNLIPRVKGSRVPLFLTQGFLEDNTKPDGTWDLFANVAGPKRAWFGMWDHVRGNDTDESGRLLMGRKGWFDEVMRFYERYLQPSSRSRAAAETDPPIAVQTSDGTWRAEQSWPPADATALTSKLRPGSYADDGTNNGTAEGGSPNGEGVWTFSPPLKTAAHLAGVPRVALDLEAQPEGNLVVDLYDVDPDGDATLISRNAHLLEGGGEVELDLYGNDWLLPAGHRIGVLVTGANAEWWAHLPSGQTVTVKSGSIALPFLTRARTRRIQGDPSVKLEDYRESAPFAVDAATIEEATEPGFRVPARRRGAKKASRRVSAAR